MSITDNMFANGLVDEALEVIELQKELAFLKGLVDSTEPFCNICKTKLVPFNYRGYYDSHSGYECNCNEFKDADIIHGAYS